MADQLADGQAQPRKDATAGPVKKIVERKPVLVAGEEKSHREKQLVKRRWE